MATTTKTRVQNFIDGEWADPADGATEPVLNPATGEAIAEALLSTAEDVERAVAAARRAFDGWAVTTARALDVSFGDTLGMPTLPPRGGEGEGA